ncbi:MAG: hypothetical protein AAF242_08200 [Bacteroidota bacterium]
MKKDMQALCISIILGISFCLINFFLFSSKGEEIVEVQESFFDRLGEEEIVRFEIKTDLSNLIAKKAEQIVQSADLQVKRQDSTSHYPIEVSLRGKTRRDLCSFPPLKLRFDEDYLAEAGMLTFDKYKLVTHCQENSDLVLKEYMAYQVYNQLTDYSFRARLVEVTYIDLSSLMDTTIQYAILLENYGEMAQRLSANKMPAKLPSHTKVSNEDYQRLVLFQYMIGNTDWNLYKQHNIKWLQTEGRAIPVPYDFDYSGLVNASYAQPHPTLPIKHVRERYLQWRGDDATQLNEMMKAVHQRQNTILQTCQQFEVLSTSSKKDMIDYLNSFFTNTDGYSV